MNVAELAERVTALLTAAMPYLQKAGDEASGEAGQQLDRGVWEAAQALWQRLRPKLETRPAAMDAVADLVSDPRDPDLQAALRVQLKKILADDTDLAAALAHLPAVAITPTFYSAQASDRGVIAQNGSVAAHMVAVGKDINGNVIIINRDVPSITVYKIVLY